MSDEQTSLFEQASKKPPPSGEDLKRRALDKLEREAQQTWFENACEAVRATARKEFEFTRDDVWDLCERTGVAIDPPGQDRRAWGAVMRSVARSGMITKTGRVRNTRRAEGHSNPKTVWRLSVAAKFPTLTD